MATFPGQEEKPEDRLLTSKGKECVREPVRYESFEFRPSEEDDDAVGRPDDEEENQDWKTKRRKQQA